MNKAIKINKISKTTHKGRITIYNKILKKKFNLNRLFIIDPNMDLATRGQHAHKYCDQIMIATQGSVKISVFKKKYKYFKLKKNEIIFVPKKHWVEINFENKKSSLIVLCNYKFDIKEYIFKKDQIN